MVLLYLILVVISLMIFAYPARRLAMMRFFSMSVHHQNIRFSMLQIYFWVFIVEESFFVFLFLSFSKFCGEKEIFGVNLCKWVNESFKCHFELFFILYICNYNITRRNSIDAFMFQLSLKKISSLFSRRFVAFNEGLHK